jgi:hypothetical protein
MDMLKVFFEKTNEDTSIYFKNKKIWACGKKYQEHQGKCPVIYLTFKDIKSQTWSVTYEKICLLLRDEFVRHKEVLSSSILDTIEKTDIQKIISLTATQALLENSLFILSKALYDHYGVEPVVIIDEYDTPIQQGYIYGFYNKIIEFMRNFYSKGLKGNSYVKQSFITGILNVVKESIYSGFNNPNINTTFDEMYSQYFGFTPDEVKEMLKYYGYENKYQEICEWYNGYCFGNTEIFNPVSLVSCLHKGCKMKEYWVNTSSNDIISKLLDYTTSNIYDNLCQLLQGKTINMHINPDFVYPQLEKNPLLIFTLLVSTGYLKVVHQEDSSRGGYQCDLAVPNKELFIVFNNEIVEKLNDINDIDFVWSIKDIITSGDAHLLQKTLKKFLLLSASFHDTEERFYHGVLLTLCVMSNNSYEVTSNREAGLGRYDIAMVPKKNNLPGILMEIKIAKLEENLEKLAIEALDQIEEKQYDSVMKQKDIKQVFKYGIAFCGKNVAIKTIEKSYNPLSY